MQRDRKNFIEGSRPPDNGLLHPIHDISELVIGGKPKFTFQWGSSLVWRLCISNAWSGCILSSPGAVWLSEAPSRKLNWFNMTPALCYLLSLSPLMKISSHKYRINLLSWAPAVPSLAHCIYRRGRNSKFQAHPQTRSQAAYKTWGIMLSEQTRSLYQENPNLYSKCSCGALDFIGSSLMATCSLL